MKYGCFILGVVVIAASIGSRARADITVPVSGTWQGDAWSRAVELLPGYSSTYFPSGYAYVAETSIGDDGYLEMAVSGDQLEYVLTDYNGFELWGSGDVEYANGAISRLIIYSASSGASSINQSVYVVPEPSSLGAALLAMAGAGGLGVLRRR